MQASVRRTVTAHEREPGIFSLRGDLPSPTGDAHRTLTLWMWIDEPSLGFGDWQTHGDLDGESGSWRSLEELLDLFHAIRNDEAVLCRGVAINGNVFETLLDLRDPEELEDELTSPSLVGGLELLSWGGTADRRVSVMQP